MDITMQMIWDRLSQKDTFLKYGRFRDQNAPLKRPILFDVHRPFESGRIYVASSEMISAGIVFPSASLLVCCGDSSFQAFLPEHIPLILANNMTLPKLFNTVQEVYDQYVDWEAQLDLLLVSNADISALLKASLPVFENPVSISDSQMNSASWLPVSRSQELPFIEGMEPMTADSPFAPLSLPDAVNVRERIRSRGYDLEPRLCEDYYNRVYNIDLFCQKQHIGQLSVISTVRDFLPSDPILMKILARYIEKFFRHRSAIFETQTESLRTILRELLNRQPVSTARLRQAQFSPAPNSSCKPEDRYLCFKIIFTDNKEALSPAYICNKLESVLPGCIVMEMDSKAVGIMGFSAFPIALDSFLSTLTQALKKMQLCAGLSRRFGDLQHIYRHFQQACASLDTAKRLGDSNCCCRFDDYVFPYMMLHSPGEFDVELVCPKKLLDLKKYDENTAADYWNVLRAYLDNGYNASETARFLYLHRSTLLKRLSRISQILEMDINDPQQMFYIRMCIYLLDMNEKT